MPNTSKLALIAMMAKINYGGYKVFDTQFPSEHLSSLGGLSIRKMNLKKLSYSFDTSAKFDHAKLKKWDEFWSMVKYLKVFIYQKILNKVV